MPSWPTTDAEPEQQHTGVRDERRRQEDVDHPDRAAEVQPRLGREGRGHADDADVDRGGQRRRRIVPPTKLTSVAVSGVPTRWRSRPFVACCHAMPMPVSERQHQHPQRDAAQSVAGERDARPRPGPAPRRSVAAP